METQTYIKINRAYFNSPLWNEKRPRTKAEAYIDMFQMATVSIRKYTVPDFNTTITLNRGEGVWSIRYLAKRWKWSRGKVETFLKILKVRQKVRQELRQGVMVTFLNDYNESQGNDIYKKDTKKDGLKTGSRQGQDTLKTPPPQNQDGIKDATLNKNGKNVKNEKENNTTKEKIFFNFEKRRFVNIDKQDIKEWGETYPACDIVMEIRKMKDWLLSNPTKRKSNYRRFISNWLTRAQDKGGTKGQVPVESEDAKERKKHGHYSRLQHPTITEEQRKENIKKAQDIIENIAKGKGIPKK